MRLSQPSVLVTNPQSSFRLYARPNMVIWCYQDNCLDYHRSTRDGGGPSCELLLKYSNARSTGRNSAHVRVSLPEHRSQGHR